MKFSDSKIIYKGTSYRSLEISDFIKTAYSMIKRINLFFEENDEFKFYPFYSYYGRFADFQAHSFFFISGKGLSEMEAKASFLGEMLERWFAIPRPNRRILCAAYKDIKNKAINPQEFTLPENKLFSYSPYKKIAWVRGYSFKKNRSVYIPADFVYWTYNKYHIRSFYKTLNVSPICYFTPNGLASGSCREEAILPALFEVIERDAVFLTERLRIARPNIKHSDVLPVLKGIIDRLKRKDKIKIFIKDLTTDIGIPVAGVYFFDKDKNFISFGSGAHINPEIALKRGVTECLQTYYPVRLGSTQAYKKNILMKDYAWHISKNSRFYDNKKIDFNEHTFSDFKAILRNIVNRLFVNKYVGDILVCPLYAGERINVVRVLVPGLQQLDFKGFLLPSKRYRDLQKELKSYRGIYRGDIVGCPSFPIKEYYNMQENRAYSV